MSLYSQFMKRVRKAAPKVAMPIDDPDNQFYDADDDEANELYFDLGDTMLKGDDDEEEGESYVEPGGDFSPTPSGGEADGEAYQRDVYDFLSTVDPSVANPAQIFYRVASPWILKTEKALSFKAGEFLKHKGFSSTSFSPAQLESAAQYAMYEGVAGAFDTETDPEKRLTSLTGKKIDKRDPLVTFFSSGRNAELIPEDMVQLMKQEGISPYGKNEAFINFIREHRPELTQTLNEQIIKTVGLMTSIASNPKAATSELPKVVSYVLSGAVMNMDNHLRETIKIEGFEQSFKMDDTGSTIIPEGGGIADHPRRSKDEEQSLYDPVAEYGNMNPDRRKMVKDMVEQELINLDTDDPSAAKELERLRYFLESFEAIDRGEGEDVGVAEDAGGSAVPDEDIVEQMSGEATLEQMKQNSLKVVNEAREVLDGLRNLTGEVTGLLRDRGEVKKATWIDVAVKSVISSLERMVDGPDEEVVNNVKIDSNGTVTMSPPTATRGREKLMAQLGADGVPDNFSNWYAVPVMQELNDLAQQLAQKREQIRQVAQPFLRDNMSNDEVTKLSEEVMSRLPFDPSETDMVRNSLWELVNNPKSFEEFQKQSYDNPAKKLRLNWKDFFPKTICTLIELAPKYSPKVMNAFLDTLGFGTGKYGVTQEGVPSGNLLSKNQKCGKDGPGSESLNLELLYHLKGFDLDNLDQYAPEQGLADSPNMIDRYRYERQKVQYEELLRMKEHVDVRRGERQAYTEDSRVIVSYGIFNRTLHKISKLQSINSRNLKFAASYVDDVNIQMKTVIDDAKTRITALWR